jgi:two-component system CheB/CheR fusion protein
VQPDQSTNGPNAPASAASSRAGFSVAGVGASAGGLAATTELLQHLGPQPGIAVVIVHHLDPKHESSLVDIFSRATTLPVCAVSEGMVVEPNHVYVVPPNAGLRITDDVLSLTPRVETGGLHLPIDAFLESLAADRTLHAIGVVLTGSGSDGTNGIKAIKAEGGVTFAQDASAEYRSMPESAIATGCVDFVLPPEGIARELVRIGERASPSSLASDDEPAFQRILSALRKASAIDFASYKQTTIRRRVARRVVVHGLSSLRDYADLLERNPAEATTLSEEALIHVTGFFRDPEAFDVMKASVFPQLLESRPRDADIRVWVPGCSTGEEVYSIAMCLAEHLTDANAGDFPVKLFGTDVSAGAIEKARTGRYPASIEQQVSPGRLRRFFTKLECAYQIRKDVRDLCVFAEHDATRDPPFAGMDLISCRNLMIYLSAALQDRVLPILHYALKEPGFLVLGTSETIRAFPGFSMVDAKNKIYTRTSASPRMVFDFARPRRADPTPAEVVAATKPSGPLDVHREADRLVLAEFAPPGVVVTDDLAIVQFRGRTGPFLEPAPGVPSFDLLRMAREELRLPLRQTIDLARAKGKATRRTGVPLGSGTAARAIEIEVIPFRVAPTAQRFFVVLFTDATSKAAEVARAQDAAPALAPSSAESTGVAQELASTRDYLQSVIEQLEASNEELKAANEEIVSSNEELRSTNEELQMAKEELQATNEELRTVNDEMAVRNAEATRLNDDLTNVLSSVEIPIVILGRDSRLRRFTPAAAKALRLVANDVGRPMRDIHPLVKAPELSQMISDVLEHLRAVERSVQAEGGRWYQLSVRPYVTLDNRIDGTVITAIDIDAMKRTAQLLAEARNYAESIVDTVRECLVVLDHDLAVRSANRAFHETFGVTSKDIEGRGLYELGRGEWNIPALRMRLDELGRGVAKLEDLRIEQDVNGTGRRAFLLTARRVEGTSSILLALDDVTERERAESAVERTEKQAFDSAVAEERERRRIAVDLHDRIGQSLALAQIKLTSVREAVNGVPRAALDDSVELLAQLVADTHTLIFDLSPPVLYDLGLKDALSWLAEEVEKRQGMHVELVDDALDKPLDDVSAALVFRAVRELLMNVFKHAKVSTARVSLRRAGDYLDIDVEDQGVGFDADEASRPPHSGFGLFSVRDQIGGLGGSVKLTSEPRQGTRVSMRVPLKTKSETKREPAKDAT